MADCASDKGHARDLQEHDRPGAQFRRQAVAVGVEKPADANALTQMGCDLGQGYLFAQPMAEDRFHTLLRQRAERSVGPAAVPAAVR